MCMQILKEDDNNWPQPDRVGRQELEIVMGPEHISFTTTKLGSLLQAIHRNLCAVHHCWCGCNILLHQATNHFLTHVSDPSSCRCSRVRIQRGCESSTTWSRCDISLLTLAAAHRKHADDTMLRASP